MGKIKLLMIVIILGMALVSCMKDNDGPQGFTEYRILKGDNQPDLNEMTLATTSLDEYNYCFRLDTSLFYNFSNSFVSKLFGLREYTGDNSIRIGYRTSADSIEIVGYSHNNGEYVISETIIKYSKKEVELMNQIPGNGIKTNIKFTTGFYVVTIAGKTVKMTRTSTDAPNGQKSRMYPYLGGNNIVAPRTMSYFLKYE